MACWCSVVCTYSSQCTPVQLYTTQFSLNISSPSLPCFKTPQLTKYLSVEIISSYITLPLLYSPAVKALKLTRLARYFLSLIVHAGPDQIQTKEWWWRSRDRYDRQTFFALHCTGWSLFSNHNLLVFVQLSRGVTKYSDILIIKSSLQLMEIYCRAETSGHNNVKQICTDLL